MSRQPGNPFGTSFLTHSSSPEDVFTPEDLTDEQEDIGRMVDSFWEQQVAPELPALYRLEPGVARRLLEKAAELGLMAISIPERYGGSELDFPTTLVIAEHVARDASYMVWEGGHTMLGTLPIVYFGTDDQKQRYLPRLARLEMLTAYALSESQSGSDALAVRTRADLNEAGTHYVLNGQKMWITNGSDADLFIVFAKVAGRDFTCFLVERAFPGVTTGENEPKMGLHGSSTTALYLDDVAVPVENVLGEVGRGHVVAFNILNLGRLKLGASAVGAAKNVLQTSIRYARERQAFGSSISEFGAIRHKLAEMAVRIFATESIVWRTVGMIEDRMRELASDDPTSARLTAIKECAAECSMVKVFGSEMLDYVVDEGVQIHGGYGYHADYLVERAYRDARINRIFEGTNEINRLIIPRRFWKRELRNAPPPPRSEPGMVGLIESAKSVALWTLGLARSAYGNSIENEQEVVMGVADIMIAAYAMESTWLRSLKIGNAGQDSIAADLSTAFLTDAIRHIGHTARKVLIRCSDSESLSENLRTLDPHIEGPPLDSIQLRRNIASALIVNERYVI